MTTNRGYLIIPKLIEQPTWGGFYIMKAKGWGKHPHAKKKFGQSYELYSGSYLSLATDTNDLSFQPEIDEIPQNSFQLEQVRAEYAEGLLGVRAVKKYNGQLKTLIKFTQAKGNSFQLHVKESDGSWVPKPESWYFFEKGLATLGLKDTSNVLNYKKICTDIETYMKKLSSQIQKGTLTIVEARDLARAYIEKKKIYHYVNSITIPLHALVDLRTGGIHHSWEENPSEIPTGNIVYEIQREVADDQSTIRSFDKGKINDDGTIRPLHVSDYFKNLDVTKKNNNPENFIQQPFQLYTSDFLTIYRLFRNPDYNADQLVLTGKVSDQYTNTKQETFHHIFIKKGAVTYKDSSIALTVGQGHSVFVPAAVRQYTLNPQEKSATVIKTYL